MPGTISSDQRAGTSAPDDLDNILNYDAAVDDFLKDLPINNENNPNAATAPTKDIDEEVTLKRRRKPVPKLNEDLLLSAHGLPKLRRISKDHLKLRGKGHEFSDIGRILNMYQLWMDDMYPRAKFRDAMVLVEKVGHSKRMQVMRRAWLDETKPRANNDDFVVAADEVGTKDEDMIMSGALGAGNELQANGDDETPHRTSDSAQRDEIPGDDELDALLADEGQANTGGKQSRGPFEEENGAEDELDLLAAEQSRNGPTSNSRQRQRGPFDDDGESSEDDLDALLAEQDEEAARNKTSGASQGSSANTLPRKDFVDEEEVMAEMGDFW